MSSLPQSTLSGDTISISDNVYRRMFRLASLSKRDVFYQFGCGEGRALVLASREFGVKRAVGIEIDKDKAQAARKKLARLPNVDVVNDDMRSAAISDASVLLFWFSDPQLVDRMTKRFKRELKSGARVITVWAPLGLTLPDKIDFPFMVSRVPFRRARSIGEQIKAIYGNDCIDFTASWLLAERYIDALEVVSDDHRRFVNMLQSMVIWINAWNMGVTCEKEIPPPVEAYLGILKTFFNIDMSEMIDEKK